MIGPRGANDWETRQAKDDGLTNLGQSDGETQSTALSWRSKTTDEPPYRVANVLGMLRVELAVELLALANELALGRIKVVVTFVVVRGVDFLARLVSVVV